MNTIEAMKQAQPKAWKMIGYTDVFSSDWYAVSLNPKCWTPLYTHPAPAIPAGWQPIETAPKDGTKVLIVNDEGVMAVAHYIEQWDERYEFVRKAKDGDVYRTVREECGYWNTDTAYCPTHWMPLPQPPKEAT